MGLFLFFALQSQAAVITVNTGADSGPGSLREAISSAAPLDTIEFSAAILPVTINLSSPLVISGDLNIFGPNNTTDDVRISGQNFLQVMRVNAGAFVAIRNLTIEQGNTSIEDGALIYNQGNVDLYNVVLRDGFSFGLQGGGAIYNNGFLNLINCQFTNNQAQNGAALAIDTSGMAFIDSCTFMSNFTSGSGNGGAIHNISDSTLMVSNTSFKTNTAANNGGGIYHDAAGALHLFKNTFEDCGGQFGGGVYVGDNADTTRFDSIVFNRNGATDGGGAIYTRAPALLNTCFLDSNTADSKGGAVYAEANGFVIVDASSFNNNQLEGFGSASAGLHLEGANTSDITNSSFTNQSSMFGGAAIFTMFGHNTNISNTTFANNRGMTGSRGGAINFTGGVHTLNSNTIVDNEAEQGGGIHAISGATVNFENNIIAGNTVTSFATDVNIESSAIGNTLGHNLIGDAENSSVSWVATDLFGNTASPLNPRLDAPTTTVGGITYFPLNCNSPAIDNGSATATAFDITGMGRSGTPDIGTTEFMPLPPQTHTVTSMMEGIGFTLRVAYESACVGDTIDFDFTLLGQAYLMSGGPIVIDKDITIRGLGIGSVTLDGGDANRIFEVNSGVTLNLSGVGIENGLTGAAGGAIINNGGTLKIDQVFFQRNSAILTADGGAIASIGGRVEISNSTFTENESASSGGAIFADGADLFLDVVNFVDNRGISAAIGGAIVYTTSTSDTLRIFASNFLNNNTQTGVAGAIHISNSNNAAIMDINNSFFIESQADDGGAIYLNSGNLNLYGDLFFNNTGKDGGAIYSLGNLQIDSCAIDSNTATGNGGGIAALGTSYTIERTSITRNTAGDDGGGLYTEAILSSLNNSTVARNQAVRGGGIAAFGNGGSISASTISNNQSSGDGGGIWRSASASASNLSVFNSTIADNIAGSSGGGIIVATSIAPLSINSSIVAGNIASLFGPDAFDQGGGMTSNGENVFGTAPTSLTVNASDLAPSSGTLNVRLGLLQNNGGPTETHALLCGSPAINKLSTGFGMDQRGEPITDGFRDAGAFEAGAFTPTNWLVTSTNDVDANSLRDAIENACDGDTIFFAAALAGNPINITSGMLNVQTDIVIQGSGVGVTIVSGGNTSDLFSISPGADVHFNDFTITEGMAPIAGGGILNEGNLTLNNMEISNCESPTTGGAIFTRGDLAIFNSTFANNNAALGGALEFAEGPVILIDSCLFEGNVGSDDAGVILTDHSSAQNNVLIRNSTFRSNETTTGNGGAFQATSDGVTTFENCIFEDNKAPFGNGGAINLTLGVANFDSCQFVGNEAFRGGSIYNFNNGTVSLFNSQVDSSRASNGGGIFNAASLVINSSTFVGDSAGNGGAINNTGTIQIDTVTISGNQAENGAGIYHNQTSGFASFIRTSTFSLNAATNSGGGLFIANQIIIENSTISTNFAALGGGIAISHFTSPIATLFLQSSTVAVNTATTSGGGIYLASSTNNILDISNSIIALNDGIGGADIGTAGGVIQSSDANLVGDTTGTGIAAEPLDLFGDNLNPLDPLLGPLQNNGGKTETHALLTCSPAINSGFATISPFSDQRGFPRLLPIDRGSYETQSAGGTNTHTVTSDIDGSAGSLRDIIDNLACDGDLILFDPALDGIVQTIGAQITISKNITIQGSGVSNTIIDGGGNDRIFEITSNATVGIFDLRMQDGSPASGNGGAILNHGTLKFENGTIASSSSTVSGGAIYTDGQLDIKELFFQVNQANLGGAIYAASPNSVTIDSTTFDGNTAISDGGALYFNAPIGDTINISHTEIINNVAMNSGGGLASVGAGYIAITNSSFRLNNATEQGGGIFGTIGVFDIEKSVVSNNQSSNEGGGLYLNAATLQIDSSRVDSNTTTDNDGGGFYLLNSGLTLNRTSLKGNSADLGSGGGIFRQTSITTDITNSTFTENSAITGGAIANVGSGLNIVNSTLSNNEATDGGAIAADVNGSFILLRASTVTGNTGWSTGGGISLAASTGIFRVDHSIVAGNFGVSGTDIFASSSFTNVSLGYNLIGDTSNANLVLEPTDTVGNSTALLDPLLEPLAFNNGNFLETHALACNSPAIDGGNPGSPTTFNDQNGTAIFNGIRDIGAFESELVLSPPTAALSGTATVDCNGVATGFLTVDFTGTPPFSIILEKNGTQYPFTNLMNLSEQITPPDSGVFTATIVTDAGCPGTAMASGVVTVDPTPAPLGVVLSGTATIDCNGIATGDLDLSFIGTPPFDVVLESNGTQYPFNNLNALNTTITPPAAGTFTVVSLSHAGCPSTPTLSGYGNGNCYSGNAYW